jgi:uncharacterized membrane protein YphA (DoxX/SURF4 family)
MERTFRGKEWLSSHSDLWWDLLRIYVGVALFIKGFVYLHDTAGLAAILREAGVPLATPLTAEIAALAHVAGGLMLAFGLFTRVAAAIQIPNVLGAVAFVHLREGLFTRGQTLELALLVLVILVLLVLGGAGRYSVDWYFLQHGPAPGATRPIAN